NEHGITKKNPMGNMEDGNIENFFEVAHRKAARKKQPIIEIAILTWIIDDCQPLYLLWSQFFKSFMEVALPEFKVPSDDKARRLNAIGAFKKCITNFILFFNGSPKNTENLRDAKRKLNYQKLKNAILYLITILKISLEKDDKDDADYLEQINLTELE
ncbi:11785_t:CDS:2, partial [Gigaspora margarita]